MLNIIIYADNLVEKPVFQTRSDSTMSLPFTFMALGKQLQAELDTLFYLFYHDLCDINASGFQQLFENRLSNAVALVQSQFT